MKKAGTCGAMKARSRGCVGPSLRWAPTGFGPIDRETASVIEQLRDVAVLNRLLHRILRVSGWQELRALVSLR